MLERAKELVVVGGRYAHFKNPAHEYVVRELAIIEATEEVGVIYEALYEAHIPFIRPLTSFTADVEHEGVTGKRFVRTDA